MDTYLRQRISANLKKMIDLRKNRNGRIKEEYRCPTPDFASYAKLPSISPNHSTKTIIKTYKQPQVSLCPSTKHLFPFTLKSSTSAHPKLSIKPSNSQIKMRSSHPSFKNRSQSPAPSPVLSSSFSEISIISKKLHLIPLKPSVPNPNPLQH